MDAVIQNRLIQADEKSAPSNLLIFQRQKGKGFPYGLTTLSLFCAIFGLAFLGFGPRFYGLHNTTPTLTLLGLAMLLLGGLLWFTGGWMSKVRKKFLEKNPNSDVIIFTPEGMIDRHFKKIQFIPWSNISGIRKQVFRTIHPNAAVEILDIQISGGKASSVFLSSFTPAGPKSETIKDYAKKFAHYNLPIAISGNSPTT